MKYLSAMVVALALTGCAPEKPVDNRASSVKVELEKSHGSATHIGGGFFVTAAHVLRDGKEANLKTGTGDIMVADVLWASVEYDIALMHVDEVSIPFVTVDCRTPEYGEDLEFVGNPMNLEYVTTWGRVSGESINIPGYWGDALPVNATIIPGMSGGGVFDADGELVGVNVGTMVMQVGMGGGPASIGYIVPSKTLCYLLGMY